MCYCRYYFEHIEEEDPDLYTNLIRNASDSSELPLPNIIINSVTEQITPERTETIPTNRTISSRLRNWLNKWSSRTSTTTTTVLPATSRTQTTQSIYSSTTSSTTSSFITKTATSAKTVTPKTNPNSTKCDKNCYNQNPRTYNRGDSRVNDATTTTSYPKYIYHIYAFVCLYLYLL